MMLDSNAVLDHPPSTSVGGSRNRDYLGPLDHLRAIAALTVVVYHTLITYRGYTEQPGWLETRWPHFWNPVATYFVEGHTAVTLFLVLSGYVLTRGVIGRSIDYWSFVGNRLLRVFPLYVFLIFLGVYIHPSTFSVAALAQTLLPFANLPGALNSEVLLAMFWTVAIELQFYLVFPFLNRFVQQMGRRYLLQLLVLFIVCRSGAYFFKLDIFHFIYGTIFGRMDAFLIGMLAAYSGRPAWMGHRLMLPCAIALLALVLTVFNQVGGYPVDAWWKLFWFDFEACAWIFVLLASLHTPWRMPGLLRVALVTVANMSYSIYLLHSTVLQIFGERKAYFTPFNSVYLNAATNAAMMLPVVLALSWLTYSVIERPFMSLRRQYVR